MKTKTAHELARELLAGPDLPIYHFDPSRAGLDDEDDTSLSDPVIERETLDAETIEAGRERAEDLGRELLTDWLMICGETNEDGEAMSWREVELAKYKKRMEWLHDCSSSCKDADGYEWGIYRVKFDENGKLLDCLQTLSDFSDLDAEMERESLTPHNPST